MPADYTMNLHIPASNPEETMEQIVRTSEILAVVQELRRGSRPKIGDTIDYFLEPEVTGPFSARAAGAKQRKPYRTRVEQWHLDEAARLLARR
jgi:hypothetical protein